MIDHATCQQLDGLLETADSILCVSHVGPDGDAIGSLLGMRLMLQDRGKTVTAALQDSLPENFLVLPGAEAVVGPEQVADHYDLIVCLDASSPDRMGRVFRPDVHADIPLVVIDHHVTNTLFGTVNWVEPRCAATCQMLVYLAQHWTLPLTDGLAECLLTGIVTDTLCFRTHGTDAAVMAAATMLMEGGANLAEITARTLNRRKLASLRLLGFVLPHVEVDDHVIWATIGTEQLARSGHRLEDDLQLNSMLISTVEADISAVFTEKIDEDGTPTVECSFRAKPGYDVSKLAYALGGGGHPPASGCTLPGTLAEVTARVVPLLKQARAEQTATDSATPE
jgi:phosphoesterase RecJ-like protein